MSYIDSFDHELVGFFGGLPLYHPLENITGGGPQDEDFSCTPAQLVLGGGSGEHPGLVLTNPGGAALHFLRDALPSELNIDERVQTILDEAPSCFACLHYAGWSLETYMSFAARCMAPAFVSPYHQKTDGLLEEWLICSLGEFVYFAMPELASEVLSLIPAACALVREPRYYNVLILPPGYKAPGGRYRGAAGEIIWGHYRWNTRAKQSGE
ncbi:MAG TPA: hypothetical protein VH590_03740 [Ktedonobacterales bacterium]|jgi:hypothetical protein